MTESSNSPASGRDPRYDFLTDDQWEKVCDLLVQDVQRMPTRGLWFIAPEFPALGQECQVDFLMDNDGMTWMESPPGMRAPLSDLIRAEAKSEFDHYRAELLDAVALSLENTVRILRAAAEVERAAQG